jgi:hypothetical protein
VRSGVLAGVQPPPLLVTSGALTVETATGSIYQVTDSIWIGPEAVTYLAGKEGAQILRWELVTEESAKMHDGRLRSAPKAQSTVKLASEITLDPGFDWLMRCDRVSFPIGGEALLHVHQGPGTRCVVRGSILIDSTVYRAACDLRRQTVFSHPGAERTASVHLVPNAVSCA